MRLVSVDTETHLIKPGMPAPRLVCVSWWDGAQGGLLDRETGLDFVAGLLVDPDVCLLFHNGPYDLGVFAAERPALVRKIFTAYDQGRVRDTLVRQMLIAIADGDLKYRTDSDGDFVKSEFSLAALVAQHLGEHLEKTDTYRLRYHELDGIPIPQWPAAARDYACTDAVKTFQVFKAQERYLLERDPHPTNVENVENEIPDELHQLCAAWALHLMSMWGVRTDEAAVDELEDILRGEAEAAVAELLPTGVLKKDKKGKVSRSMSEIQRRVAEACRARGEIPPMTDKSTKFPEGQIKTDHDTLVASGDPALLVLAAAGKTMKLLDTYVPVLRAGATRPLNPRYNVLVESGRTSCSKPNMQNPPRAGGVRECFVPRPGYWFARCDYDTLELRSLAQVCLKLFGYSAMADALQRGEDLHLRVGAQLIGMPLEEAQHWRSNKHPSCRKGQPGVDATCLCPSCTIKDARQLAKPANFGFPGGMRPKAFVEYARGYGLNVAPSTAEKIYEEWQRSWPEMNDYFRHAKTLIDSHTKLGQVRQLFSGRLRGQVPYTAACNTYFQGLAADGAKEALWLVAWECYVDKTSPLYGSRPAFFLHDEIICEVPIPRAAAAAQRLGEVMREAMQKWIPDIPIGATPSLMKRWYKEAEAVYDADGKLVPWEPK